MRRILFCIAVFITFLNISAQIAYNPLSPPNTFRNADNPHYWKNKKPFPGYWQQDVHYTIEATVHETSDIIEGKQKLIYWNNSPDTLSEVFFHLYQNAFQPGSYYDDLHQNNGIKPRYGKYEQQKKGTEVQSFLVNGKKPKMQYDNTILRITLPNQLLPNQSITFEIEFKTYFDGGGNVGRRMKTFASGKHKHYDGVHWYPRIAVYDRKFGWCTDQHLGREFYGDMGCYDVELNFAENYVVGATGFLTNRAEVLPKELMDRLRIENFKELPMGNRGPTIIEYDSTKRKTWKYHAENVHDFSFTADPNYRIGEAKYNDITCYAFVQEPHASKWQNAAEYAAKVIEVLSKTMGKYEYHKMIVADAKDGMEYPMLTLDGGYDPNYRSLFAHEIGHNWFYGMINTNETYRASMDEGFTQFLTAWTLERIDGNIYPEKAPKSKYKQYFYRGMNTRDRAVLAPYIKDATREADPPLNTHSDAFHGALGHGGGYGHVYYKAATMLYNLEYVLGDSLFLKAMQHYVQKWKFAHPYPEDFRGAIMEYVKTDLNWFFDQWLETTKKIDYKIASIKKTNNDTFLIEFKRKGRMQMPIDFTVYSKEGKIHNYYIPNTYFQKNTSATVLPKWTGWDKLHPTYTAKVHIPGGISDVVIDPSGRLADVYQLNNSTRSTKYYLDHQIKNFIDIRNYELHLRPDVWYNGFDGVKIGLHLNGDYMNQYHKLHLTLWANTSLLAQTHYQGTENARNNDPVSGIFSYRTPVRPFVKNAEFRVDMRFIDGLAANTWGLKIPNRKQKTFIDLYVKAMYRRDSVRLNYLIYPQEWTPNALNATFNAKMYRKYKYKKGSGIWKIHLRGPLPGSDFNYAYINGQHINRQRLGKLLFKSRVFAQYGTGNKWASESQLFLAGGNPENMMNNKYTRSSGLMDPTWNGFGENINHFHPSGGLNLRGYSGYIAPFINNQGQIELGYKGYSGAAINAELEFQNLIKLKPASLRKTFRIKTYLFSDVGILDGESQNKWVADNIRADAGFGVSASIIKWGPLEKVKPLTIRADFPVFLNRIPSTETDYIKFRWVIGVNRAF